MYRTNAQCPISLPAVLLSITVVSCSGSADRVADASSDAGGSKTSDTSALRGGSNGVGGISTSSNPVATGGAASGAAGGNGTAGRKAAGGGSTSSGTVIGAAGAISNAGASMASGGLSAAGGTKATAGSSATSPAGGTKAGGGSSNGGAGVSNGGTKATGGASSGIGGATGGSSSKASGGSSSGGGGTNSAGGKASGGTSIGNGGTSPSGGSSSNAGTASQWPNIRVVGNHLCDRWGRPFALRSIESMFGNGSSNASAFVAGHKALGANALGPLPNTSVTSASAIEGLLAAAHANDLVIGLNADHTNQGERFLLNTQIQNLVNRYPNVFLQEAVELGSDMTASEWVGAAKAKVDAYVGAYPDKPLKIGSPMGGRSPRYALDHCQEVVDYYRSKGGRGGLIFTCQLYWKATTSSWSYQEENGFSDGLPGILQAIDAMAASPCLFVPGLDNQDDVGYTGWREVMDHIRTSQTDPTMRLGFQWWVYYNSGDPYDNDLTTNANDALAGITTTGRDVKAKLEQDRQYVELGPLNP